MPARHDKPPGVRGRDTGVRALGGSIAGGILGPAVEHAAADTNAHEYIVRKPNGDLLSVTQKGDVPLKVGTKVLIAGNQARIAPDYTEADAPGREKPPAPVLGAPVESS